MVTEDRADGRRQRATHGRGRFYSWILGIGSSLVAAVACGGNPDVVVDQGSGGTAADGHGGEGQAASGGTSNSGTGGHIITGGTGSNMMCTPKTCEDLDLDCGRAPDGCGDVIECGECTDGAICGFKTPNVCSTPDDFEDLCEPVSKADACDGKECGVEGDGCGDTYDCGSCDDDEICGLEDPFQCAKPPTGDPDDCPAKIESCEDVDAECGFVGNGCGGVIDCAEELGTDCADDETCIDGKCEGGSVDCEPLDQAAACGTKECGKVSDGCGSTIDCGSCAQGEMCGFRAAYQCDVMDCQPRTEQEACANKECGTVYDGCGTAPENTFNCGTCASGEYCGLTQAFQCDAPQQPSCTPTATTCAGLGWACGTAIDNCGNTYDCEDEGRKCGPLETCVGGINGPTTCMGSGGGNCPLCDAVPECTGGAVTRLTGRVTTPGRNDGNTANQVGVPNAFVYILRTNNIADLPPVSSGIPSGGESCDRCDEQNLGSVLTGAVTDATGAYTLEGNIPVGTQFILVTKVGKFRRAVQMTLQSGAGCTTTALTSTGDANPTRLPRAMTGDGGIGVNIPRVAIQTGEIDAMECVFWKMGLSTAEFTVGSGTTTGARLHLYRGLANNGNLYGARISTGTTPSDVDLYGSLPRMQSYDMVVSDCEGQRFDSDFSQRNARGGNVMQYVNRGGRMFASHLGFSWLHQNGTQAYATDDTRFTTGLGPAATWQTGAVSTDVSTGTGIIAFGRTHTSPRIDNFAAWMVREGVTTAPNYNFTINEPRSQVTALNNFTEEFVHCNGGNCAVINNVDYRRTQQFSFNTPYSAPANAACGRVAYSGFHVSFGGGSAPYANAIFPDHCNTNSGNLTNQEKVLLYMIFDLGACVGDEPDPPTCDPQACPAYPACGTQANGCGGTQECGCPSGEACIGGQCEEQDCVPTTCEAEGATCQNISDGCGHVLACDCPGCDRQTCEDADAECGLIGDGCGGEVDCGPCPMGQVCTNVGGKANQCFGCEPRTCDDAGAECGYIGDGCGASIDCGPCPLGEICGAQSPNQCGGGTSCKKLKCDDVNAECGLIGDGCGGQVDCGPCPPGEVCGIEQAFRCGPPPPCVPRTCDQAEAECGVVGDGCGDVIDCGECQPGETCGIYNPNKCDPIR